MTVRTEKLQVSFRHSSFSLDNENVRTALPTTILQTHAMRRYSRSRIQLVLTGDDTRESSGATVCLQSPDCIEPSHRIAGVYFSKYLSIRA